MTRSLDLLAWIAAHHGVAHTADLRRVGFTKADVADAVGSGALRRVRRSWLVSADADGRRVAAATVSGRTTCATEASLAGVWVPPHEGTHVAVAPNAARFDAFGLVVHWAPGPAPVAPHATSDHPLNVLFHVARCLPPRDALAVWESAIRTRYVDARHLISVDWGSTVAHRLARTASRLSDSGLETIFIDGLRVLGIRFRQQVMLEGHPVDVLIGDRLVIQLDGFEHHRAADRRRDIRHDAILQALGYTVLRFDFFQVLFEWDFVERSVVQAMAQGRHLVRVGR
jgi:very-short-patch-repair endonuclease